MVLDNVTAYFVFVECRYYFFNQVAETYQKISIVLFIFLTTFMFVSGIYWYKNRHLPRLAVRQNSIAFLRAGMHSGLFGYITLNDILCNFPNILNNCVPIQATMYYFVL